MRSSLRLLALALVLGAGGVLVSAIPASAHIDGPCTASATADGASTDLTSATEWHMGKDAIVNGEGHSEPELTSVGVFVSVLGVPYEVFSADGKGHGGSAGPFHASDYSGKARVIGAGGAAGPCSGTIKIIFDGVSPVQTAVGLAGLIAAIVGGLGMLASARGHGFGAKFGAILLGLIGGAGLGLVLEEAAVLDPFSKADLAVPIAGGLLGLVLSMVLGRGGKSGAPSAPP